jgi:dihydrofolate synthase/folylpolyglutamate synthase
VTTPHWPPFSRFHEIVPGLERMHLLLDALGNPERRLPPVIHVAGTNGKGSTIAFLRSIFECQGYSVHSYTSPHLISWNERIVLSGEIVSDAELFEALEECRRAEERAGIAVSHFEGFTAAALLLYSKRTADVTLVEVGLGGRYDATNVFPEVLCSVITPISFDHQEFLGDSLESIAWHKSGIITGGSPCVVAPQTNSVSGVLRIEAEKAGVPLFDAGGVWNFTTSSESLVVSGDLCGKRFEDVVPLPTLKGTHQHTNAAVAVVTCHALEDSLPTSVESRRKGVSRASWSGRLQRLEGREIAERFPPRWELLCDAAHNVAGAAAIGEWLASEERKPMILVAACSRNRSLRQLLNELLLDDLIALVIFCGTIDGVVLGPGEDPIDIPVPVYRESSVEAAMLRGSQIARTAEEGRLLVLGSLHLVGTVLRSDSV